MKDTSDIRKTLELKLISGNHIIKTFYLSKIYGVIEKRRLVFELKNEFPWISIYKKPYTQFRYQDTYESMTSYEDSRYKVDCALTTFINHFGIEYKSWDETVMEAAIRGE